MPLGLIALAMGGFGIGLTEFVILGLLPEVSADFQVTESVAGYLISGYALSVAIGAVLLTAAVTRFERKRVLLSLMVLFIIGNLMSALAPTYEVMMGGRVVAALCHGAFFGIGSVVAADMVAPNKRAGAIAMMFAGLTIANVLGVPFGTFIGQQFGWRSTFGTITVIGVIALIGIAFLVPTTPASTSNGGLRGELGAFRNKQVWLSIVITILGFGGMFGAFTYMFVGNFLGAKAADRSLTKALVWILALLTVVLSVFAATAGNKTLTMIALFLMGAFGFATVPGLQMRIMNYASSAPTMASGANIAAFNVGNALGAWLGGITIAAGLGFTSPLWVGAAMTALALIFLLVATAVECSPSPSQPKSKALA